MDGLRHGQAWVLAEITAAVTNQWLRCTPVDDYSCLIRNYHLVMTNSLPWKDPPFLSSVNRLTIYQWAIYTYHGYVK